MAHLALEANQGWIMRLPPGTKRDIATNFIGLLLDEHNGWRQLKDKKSATYGEIVRLVDYMRDNYRLLHGPESGDAWPRKPDDGTARFLQDLGPNMLAQAHASHSNQDHFQGRAFYMHWFWHSQAVAVAQGGNLWAALLMNAYADHFLQDTFAPGHITGPRDDNSHDLPSLLIHDSYNLKGMRYIVRQPSALRPALKLMNDLSEEPKNSPVRLLKCEIAALIAAEGPVTNIFHGDGQASKNPAQPVIITAYCTQSIRDVLESYLTESFVNSFPHYRWNIRFARSNEGPLEFIDVWQSFGDLTCIENDLDDDVLIKMPLKGLSLSEPVSEQASPVALSIRDAASGNPAFGLSLGLHSHMDKADAHAQALVDFETLVWAERWDFLRDDYPNLWIPSWPDQFGVTLGYTGLIGSHSQAQGVMTRFVFPVSKINLQVSLALGARYHYRGLYSGWADFQSVRFEWGMHLANAFFGIGHDYHIRDGRLHDGLSFDAGISVALPYSRIKKVFD